MSIGRLLPALALSLLLPQTASALTSGTALPLDQYQAGSEQTTLVDNGNFENNTKWSLTSGEAVRAAPFEPPSPASTVGDFAFQALLGDPDSGQDIFSHDDTFTFNASENYVLSAYMWNHGSFDIIFVPGPVPISDLARVELSDGSNSIQIALDSLPGSNSGYFVYVTFSGSLFTSPAGLTAAGQVIVGPEVSPYVQIDNIAITPESQFSAPTLIPEPTSAGVVMLASLIFLRRRAGATWR